METNDELFYGKQFADANSAFKEDLSSIEKEHTNYFQSRKPKDSTDKFERLHNHYFFKFDRHVVNFDFLPNSDLPEQIKEQCLLAFKTRFTSKE